MNAALPAILALLAVASYFQTLTGFGLGMIVMGMNAALGLVPVPVAATLVSVVTLTSSAVALRGGGPHLPRRALAAALAGMLPAVPLGMWLLHQLARGATHALQFLLGLLIAWGSVNLLLKSQRQAHEASRARFAGAGLLSGLMGGLFAVSGPPLIYLGYRQPWTALAVRTFLITNFALLALARLALEAAQGGLTREVLWLGAASVPAVAGAAWLGRRTAHRCSPRVLRWIVFALLLGVGGFLMLRALGGTRG